VRVSLQEEHEADVAMAGKVRITRRLAIIDIMVGFGFGILLSCSTSPPLYLGCVGALCGFWYICLQ